MATSAQPPPVVGGATTEGGGDFASAFLGLFRSAFADLAAGLREEITALRAELDTLRGASEGRPAVDPGLMAAAPATEEDEDATEGGGGNESEEATGPDLHVHDEAESATSVEDNGDAEPAQPADPAQETLWGAAIDDYGADNSRAFESAGGAEVGSVPGHGDGSSSWTDTNPGWLHSPGFLGGAEGDGAGGSPDAGDGAFDVVLRDDFERGYETGNLGRPYDGGTYQNGAFAWSADDVAVEDGVLRVETTRQDDGSWTAGGFNTIKAGKTITHGKIAFDGRVEEGKGTMGVFLTWPQSDAWPSGGEIDILETPGEDAMHTLHWDGGGGADHFESERHGRFDETRWNRYELTWLPDLLKVEVNGETVFECADPAHIPDGAHGFGVQGYVAAAHEEWAGGGPDGSTPDVVAAEIDNLVMSQWTDAATDHAVV